MVYAQAGIAVVGIPEIIPIGINNSIRIQVAQGIGKAQGFKPFKSSARFRPEQRIVYPPLRFVGVCLSGNNVKIPHQYQRQF